MGRSGEIKGTSKARKPARRQGHRPARRAERLDQRQCRGSPPAVITVLGPWTHSSHRPQLGPHDHTSGSPRHLRCATAPLRSQRTGMSFCLPPQSGQSSALSHSGRPAMLTAALSPRCTGLRLVQEIKAGLHHKHCNTNMFRLPGVTKWIASVQAAPSPPIRVLALLTLLLKLLNPVLLLMQGKLVLAQSLCLCLSTPLNYLGHSP